MIAASKKIDYGIMLMASLPEPTEQRFRSLQEIADARHLSAGFLSQVMMPLRKAGLVRAKEGVSGGYQLSRPSDQILLSEVYEAIEGPLCLTACQNEEKACACVMTCPTKEVWADLQSLVKDYLQKRSIAEFKS